MRVSGSPTTFAGNSLTVSNAGSMLWKATGVYTVNNLILAGGTLAQGATGGTPDEAELAGAVTVTNISCIDGENSPRLFEVQAALSGPGGLTIQSSSGSGGVVIFDTKAKTYAGNTTVSANAILRAGLPNVFPNGAGAGDFTVNGTLDLNTLSQSLNGLNGSGVVDTVAGGTPALTVGSNDANGTFSGVIQDSAGALTLVKVGAGTLTLSGNNSYSGGTTINGVSGTTGTSLTVVNASFEVPAISNWDYQNTSGAANTYNFNGMSGFGWTFGTGCGLDHNSGTWYTLAAPNGSQAAFIQGAGGTASLAQSLSFPVTGTYTISFSCVGRGGIYGPNDIQVQMDGAVLATISAASQSQTAWQAYTATYRCTAAGSHTLAFVGVTTNGDKSSCIDKVQVAAPASSGQGTLLVSGVLGGSGAVTVQTNAILGGTGAIMGPVTVQAGGTLSPGAGLGTLSISNTLTLAAGSTTFVEVNAQTLAEDLVQGITTAAYGGNLVVSNLAGALAAGQSFKLVSASSASGNFSSITPSPGANLTWTFNPASGALSVAALPPPQFTQFARVGNGSFTMSGTGPSGQGYHLRHNERRVAIEQLVPIATGRLAVACLFSPTPMRPQAGSSTEHRHLERRARYGWLASN